MKALTTVIILALTLPDTAWCDAVPVETAVQDATNTSSVVKKKKRPRRKKARKRPRCSRFAPPKYRRMVRNWQKRHKGPKIRYRDGLRDLILYAVNHGERIRVFPYLPDGTLDPEVIESFKHLMRDKHTDGEHDIHLRLLKLLYRIADRFDARQINIISGYREAPNATSESNHQKGLAVDFMVPGVPLAAVAREARKLGHVGVGFYPSSGFIHLDTRGDGPSYFWIDRSGPGLGPCLHRMLAQHGHKMDRKWSAEKDEPERHKNKKGELLGATEPPPEPPEAPMNGG